MRISFILSSLYLSGGVRVVIQYANRLAKRGHKVSLIIPKGTIDLKVRKEVDPGVNIIEAGRSIHRNKKPFQLLSLAWQMADIVPDSDVIIATHTPTTAVSFLASKILKRGKPVWFYMDYIEMFDGRPIEKWLLRNALRWHEFAVTLSEACIEELHSYSMKKVYNIGLGIENRAIFNRASKDRSNDPETLGRKIVFFIGDSRPRKGLLELIKAAEEVYRTIPELALFIASKEELKLSASVPIKIFLRPNDEELVGLYSSCDIFVSASWYEGFGLPGLEAMACGAAVVTTDSRGIREYAVNGENCLIVPPKDPAKLAEAIVLLLSNPELAERLRQNGPITASRFTWESATDRFENALKSIDLQTISKQG